MRKLIAAIMLFLSTIFALSQTTPKFQPGTIMAVTPHTNSANGQDSDGPAYDVSVKVGDTLYVVLYTPHNGSRTVAYAAGMELLVAVNKDTLTFNRQETPVDVPILRRESLPPRPTLDWSKAPSQYFSMKLENLTTKLSLTDDQQTKIKPILEQESGELAPYWNNPSVSRKEKLNILEKVVLSSDAKMKPILTADQWDKLQTMRTAQKQELKDLKKAAKAN
jgi:hypothetical protein